MCSIHWSLGHSSFCSRCSTSSSCRRTHSSRIRCRLFVDRCPWYYEEISPAIPILLGSAADDALEKSVSLSDSLKGPKRRAIELIHSSDSLTDSCCVDILIRNEKNKRTETKGGTEKDKWTRQTDRQSIRIVKIIKLRGWEEEELTGYWLTQQANWKLDHREFDPNWFRNCLDHWHSIVISLGDVHRDHDLHQHLADDFDWQRHWPDTVAIDLFAVSMFDSTNRSLEQLAKPTYSNGKPTSFDTIYSSLPKTLEEEIRFFNDGNERFLDVRATVLHRFEWQHVSMRISLSSEMPDGVQ